MRESNIVRLYPNQDISGTLRKIADQLDSGEVSCKNMTIIGDGSEMMVMQLGSLNDDYAIKDAVFNLTYGIGFLTFNTFKACEADD